MGYKIIESKSNENSGSGGALKGKWGQSRGMTSLLM